MGLLQKYKEYKLGRIEKKIQRYKKTIKNAKALKEDRTIAIEFFVYMKDMEIAVPALLERFSYSLEHGINDEKEKDLASRGIVKYGKEVLPMLRDHLKNTTKIAWPIKILHTITESDDEIVAALLESLNYGDITFNEAAVDKNYDVLCHLIEYKIPDIVNRLAPFLKDQDERVRFACVEVMIEQAGDDENIRELLEPFLADDSVENRRIKMAVVDLFMQKNWRVSDVKKFENTELGDNIFITKKGKLEKRIRV